MNDIKELNEHIINKFNEEGYVVVDNLIPPILLEGMRYWALTTDYDPNQIYSGGYRTRDFGDNQRKGTDNTYFQIPELRETVKILSALDINKDKEFSRGWFFIHQNKCKGVGPHADPASININIWVTPIWCVKDHSKNGLKVWDQKHPDNWSWDQYNRDTGEIDEFLESKNAKERKIPYAFNRATIFDSAYFHATDDVHMHPGHHNKRINFTFMFIDKDKNAQDYL